MENKFVWSDLFLRFWSFAADNPEKCMSLAIGFCFFNAILFSMSRLCNNNKSKISDCVVYTIIPGILVISAIMAPLTLPDFIESFPNSPYKEELRQKALTVGDTVWILKRDESGTPISIDEHTIFAKQSDSILVDDILAINNVDSQNIVLRKFPISDCYSNKEDALAFLEKARED